MILWGLATFSRDGSSRRTAIGLSSLLSIYAWIGALAVAEKVLSIHLVT